MRRGCVCGCKAKIHRTRTTDPIESNGKREREERRTRSLQVEGGFRRWRAAAAKEHVRSRSPNATHTAIPPPRWPSDWGAHTWTAVAAQTPHPRGRAPGSGPALPILISTDTCACTSAPEVLSGSRVHVRMSFPASVSRAARGRRVRKGRERLPAFLVCVQVPALMSIAHAHARVRMQKRGAVP